MFYVKNCLVFMVVLIPIAQSQPFYGTILEDLFPQFGGNPTFDGFHQHSNYNPYGNYDYDCKRPFARMRPHVRMVIPKNESFCIHQTCTSASYLNIYFVLPRLCMFENETFSGEEYETIEEEENYQLHH
ncbi:hypothetical protein CHUAL_005491 [Chamberlinius hualienensis]